MDDEDLEEVMENPYQKWRSSLEQLLAKIPERGYGVCKEPEKMERSILLLSAAANFAKSRFA